MITLMTLWNILGKSKNILWKDKQQGTDSFRLLFEVVQKSTQGRSRHITMLAMSDLIGKNFHCHML